MSESINVSPMVDSVVDSEGEKITRILSSANSEELEIINAVALKHMMTPELLLGKKFTIRTQQARCELYRALKNDLGLSLVQIALICNRADSSISSAFRSKHMKTLTGNVRVNPSPVGKRSHRKEVKTWLSESDCVLFRKLLAKHNVSEEEMIRGIIVDALYEEFAKQ